MVEFSIEYQECLVIPRRIIRKGNLLAMPEMAGGVRFRGHVIGIQSEFYFRPSNGLLAVETFFSIPRTGKSM